MPLLYAKRQKTPRWEDAPWKAFRSTTWWPGYSIWSNGRISPFFAERHLETTSIWSYSLARCIPRLCLVCGVEAGKETLWPQTLKTWRRWTRLKSTPEGSMQREVLTPTKGEMFIFPVADGTVKISGGGQRRKTTTLIRDSPDGEEQGNLRGEPDELSSPTPQQDDSTLDDAEAGNDFWPITWDFIRGNPESNCTCRLQNHSLFHRITVTLLERHTHDTTWCNDAEKYWWLLGSGWRENYQMHGQASQDLFYWMKGHLMHIHGPGETHKETNNLKTWQCMARYVEAYFWCSENQKQSKNGLSRYQSSIMPDNYVVSSSLNQMMKNFKTLWKTLVESRKLRCQQQCFVKHQQIAAVKPAGVLRNARPNMLVLSMPTNLWG